MLSCWGQFPGHRLRHHSAKACGHGSDINSFSCSPFRIDVALFTSYIFSTYSAVQVPDQRSDDIPDVGGHLLVKHTSAIALYAPPYW